MFINGLNRGLSLPVERTRIKWETVCTPDLVNLANQLTQTLDKSPMRKTAKILNLQLQQRRAPKWNKNFPSFCYYCKETGLWKRNLSTLGNFTPLTSLSNVPSILNDRALRTYRGSFQTPL